MKAMFSSSLPWRVTALSVGAFALALLILTAGAGAESPPGRPPAAEQAQRFQKNQGLIEALVHGGLHLAAKEEPLERARSCKIVVEQFAVEIGLAADNREGGRVKELGQHLRALLEDGVAINLTVARGNIPPGSAREKQLHEVRAGLEALTSPLQERLRLVKDNDDVQQAFRDLAHGRDKVTRAIELPDKNN
jgi:hypothetical protein